MRVAVIIPAFNAGQFLLETVRSVREQTHHDWSLVVVDNGSRDETLRIAEASADADPRIDAIRLESNVLAGGARNAGLAHVVAKDPRPDAVMFLDADDILLPGALETLVRALHEAPECAAAYGNAQYIDQSGNGIRQGELEEYTRRLPVARGGKLAFVTSGRLAFESLVIWNSIATPGMGLIRAAALERVGGFDLECWPAEDWDHWIRVSRVSPLAFVDLPVLGYRQHTNNLSHNTALLRGAKAAIIRKALSDPTNSAEQRAMVRTGTLARERYLMGRKLGFAWQALSRGRVQAAGKETILAAAATVRWARGVRA